MTNLMFEKAADNELVYPGMILSCPLPNILTHLSLRADVRGEAI